MPEYTIYVGADHRGFAKKQEVISLLQNCHPGMVHVEDLGALELDPDDDFNDPAIAVSKAVLANEHSFGVLICASSQGVCIQANRFKGIRAISARTPEDAVVGREDDYANIVCLSGEHLSATEMEKIVKALCHTRPKTDDRYLRRVRKLDEER